MPGLIVSLSNDKPGHDIEWEPCVRIGTLDQIVSTIPRGAGTYSGLPTPG